MSTVTSLWCRSIARTVIVQIATNRMAFRHMETGRTCTLDATTPFSNSRLPVSDVTSALALLRAGIARVAGRFGLAPAIVFCLPADLDGGVSDAETRVLHDLGDAAGARAVATTIGNPSDDEIATLLGSPARRHA